jgi:Sigma-70, region 4
MDVREAPVSHRAGVGRARGGGTREWAGCDHISGSDPADVCLNALQARKARREDTVGVHIPDPIIGRDGAPDPEHAMILADSVGLALQIVLDNLPPLERLAFVLHDMFDVPFDEIAPMLGRSPTAARQLASRARRRVRGAPVPRPDPDLARQRQIVDAFFAAARNGDFNALVAVLDPDVVLRSDGGERRGASFVRRGAADVARSALAWSLPSAVLRPALVNGAVGVVVINRGRPFAVMGFTVARGKIVEIDAVLGAERLARFDFPSSMMSPRSPQPNCVQNRPTSEETRVHRRCDNPRERRRASWRAPRD